MRSLFILAVSVFLLGGCGHATNTASIAPVNANDQKVVADGVANAPTPTPMPTPIATPTQDQSQSVAESGTTNLRPPTNPPPPAKLIHLITGPGGFSWVVGAIGGCANATRTVPYGGAYIDLCEPGTWFDCHISVCGNWNGWAVGTEVHYIDGYGTDHAVRITSSGVYTTADAQAGRVPAGVYTFQVCIQNTANSPVRVLTAA